MALVDPEAKASWAGRTPVLWPGRWPDVWSPKRGIPQKLCGSTLSQKLLASVVHTLTCANYFRWSPGTKMAPADAEAKPFRAGQTPVLWPGRCPDVWSSKRGPPQKLCGSLPIPEAVSFCSPHSHLCRLLSVESRNEDGSRRC